MGQLRARGERAEDYRVGGVGEGDEEEHEEVEARRHRARAVQHDRQGREETEGQLEVGALVCSEVFKVWLSSEVEAV